MPHRNQIVHWSPRKILLILLFITNFNSQYSLTDSNYDQPLSISHSHRPQGLEHCRVSVSFYDQLTSFNFSRQSTPILRILTLLCSDFVFFPSNIFNNGLLLLAIMIFNLIILKFDANFSHNFIYSHIFF